MDKNELKQLIKEVAAENAEATKEEAPKTVETKFSADALVDKIGDRIADAIREAKGGNDADGEYLKEKLFNPNNGLKAIAYPSLDKIKSLSDDEKIVTFFKALVMKGKDYESDKVFKALVEGTTNDGGYLVPAPLATEVWRILPDMSVMRRIARTIPMTSHTLDLNSLTARPSAYWIGEYQSKTTTSADFGQVTLTANKLVALMPASHELIMDANIDVVRFVIELFAEAIALAEDKAFFTGSGTGQPKGISTETLSSKSAGASLDFDDVIDLINLTPAAIRRAPTAGFVGHQNAIKLLRKVKDSDGAYIWRDSSVGRMSGQTERLPDTAYGYPVYEQNDLSENELYFGDWKYYIVGDRQQITVSTTDEGGEAWRRDSTEIKAVERVDGRAVLTGAFAKLTDV